MHFRMVFSTLKVQAAVSDTTGLIEFPALRLTESGNFGILGLHMEQALGKEPVRLCTLDDLAPETTKLVKIDVEGHESAVMRGATRTLEHARPVWLLEAGPRHDVSNREARSILMDAGYDLFWFYSPFVTLDTPRKPTGVPTRRTGDSALVALPPGIPNLWNLPPVNDLDEPWPASVQAYDYLKKFGY